MDLNVFQRYHDILTYLKFPESESMDEVTVKKLLSPPLRQECFYKWVVSEMGEPKLTLRKFLVDNGICLPSEYSLFLSTEKLSMERQLDILNKTFTDLLIKHNTSSYIIAALVPDLLPRTLLLTRRLHQLKVETDEFRAENQKLQDCYDSLRTLPEEFKTATFEGAIMNMHTKSSLFEDFFTIIDSMVELSVDTLCDMEPDSYDEIDDLLPQLFRMVAEYQNFVEQTKDKIRFWTQNNVPKNYALDDELLLKLTELNL